MDVITREELKERLDHGTPFKLIMVLDENAFARKHIPGSINIPYGSPALDSLNPDELVVYCSGMPCPVSWLIKRPSAGASAALATPAASPTGRRPATWWKAW